MSDCLDTPLVENEEEPRRDVEPEGMAPYARTAGTSPRKGIIWKVCVFILVMELAERLCFYTFSGSMVIFLRDYLQYSQVAASAQNSVFNTLVEL